jgi:hypothetical protein
MGDPLDLEALRKLLKESSCARWEAEERTDGHRIYAGVYAQFGGAYPDMPAGEAPVLIARCQDVRDARLVAAARTALPALIEANERLHAALDALYPRGDEGWGGYVDRLSMEFYRETHVWPPGKDAPLEMHHEHDEEERRRRWQAWLDEHRAKLATAARRALGEQP